MIERDTIIGHEWNYMKILHNLHIYPNFPFLCTSSTDICFKGEAENYADAFRQWMNVFQCSLSIIIASLNKKSFKFTQLHCGPKYSKLYSILLKLE